MGGVKSKAATKEALNLIDELTEQNKVTVFSKTYCGFCKLAKTALDSTGVEYFVLELDTIHEGKPTGDEIQQALASKTGQRTVPNVFIGKESIGGGQEVSAMKANGQLQEKLKQVGAL